MNCKRCNAPCETRHCSLCALEYLQGHATKIDEAGAEGGLEQLVLAASRLRFVHSDEKVMAAIKAADEDDKLAGKCVLVKPTRRGLDRCLSVATQVTVDGERCCQACWEARGGR
jgi:hypothetical protein